MHILDLLDIEIDEYMVKHQKQPLGIRLSYEMLRIIETEAIRQQTYLGMVEAVGGTWAGWKGIPLAIDRTNRNRFLLELISDECELLELKYVVGQ